MRMLLVAFMLALTGLAWSQQDTNLQYRHWQDLPASPLKHAFAEEGSPLINNLNLVAEDSGKPVLIRGGGFTKANLDWLVKDMGVRTIIDLRGFFIDDNTQQLVVHSPQALERYKKQKQIDKLRNLSPRKTEAYVAQLQKELHTPLQYVHISATDPKLLTYLDQATPQKPAVMFCQHGVNRSGTAWGMYAAEHDWPEDKALKVFGISNGKNGYQNKRDIDYGYRVFKSQPKNASASVTP